MKPVYFFFILLSFLSVKPALAQITDSLAAKPADTSKPKNTAPIENAVRALGEDSTPVSIIDSVVAEIKQPVQPKAISLRSVVIPSAMIAYGAFTFSSKGLRDLNLSFRNQLWENRTNGKTTRIDNYLIWAPSVAVYALNLAGVKGKNNLLDRSAIYVLSNAIGNGLVFSTKNLTNVIRPDSSNNYSFPSGHTAKAFLAAEFLRQEYKHRSAWYGVAGYAVAVSTGVLRMYNNKHWLNDVIAGAGVGILSTRISYWLYPKLKNSVLRSRKRTTMLLPTYQNGAFGVGMVSTF
jgi:membrane-associated phospholipid phosphatase